MDIFIIKNKKSMKKIYVITQGSYSDYRICTLCSTKEIAEEATKLYGGSVIEEYDLDYLPNRPKGEYYWCINMDWDGNIINTPSTMGVEYEKDFILKWQPYSYSNSSSVSNKIQFSVWASDENIAIKSCNEKRSRLIAVGYRGISWDEYTKLKQVGKLLE